MTNSRSIQLRFIKFTLLLLFSIPSLLSSIFIIHLALHTSLLRKSFYYETSIYLIFLILLKTILNIPVSLGYYARGYVVFKSKGFCHYWQFLDYTLTGCIVWCSAIFTIERYILVFYPAYLRFKRQKIFIHYLPIILSNFYLIIFYIYSNLILSCGIHEDYSRHLCGDPCLERVSRLSRFNWLFNVLLPVFIVIFGSMFLLIRVLWTRRKIQRNLKNWSKNWKMVIQLLGIAVAYALVWIPLSIITSIDSLDRFTEDYLYYLTYIAEMSIPIVTFCFTPEINRRLRGRVQPSITRVATITAARCPVSS